ncbi:MAG: alr0857 family protein [Waterburya sp.]
MLKITYLKEGIYLESLDESLETWKANRILVSLQAGMSIYVELGTACLILPSKMLYMKDLAILEAQELLEITPCDEEYMEISLSGTWIAKDEHSEEGIFVCAFDGSSEQLLYKSWQKSQIEVSVFSE